MKAQNNTRRIRFE